jgi:hypothetical protein
MQTLDVESWRRVASSDDMRKKCYSSALSQNRYANMRLLIEHNFLQHFVAPRMRGSQMQEGACSYMEQVESARGIEERREAEENTSDKVPCRFRLF